MAADVTSGASLMCTFGTAPGNLTVTSQMKAFAQGSPMATITDISLGANISPFGMCTSMANPAVASATAAALGVLTPQPCTMIPAGTWVPGKPKVMIGGQPCLANDCQLHCSIGQGVISILNPGQTKVII